MAPVSPAKPGDVAAQSIEDRGCLHWKDWWCFRRMFPPSAATQPKPGHGHYEDGDYAILYRWFDVARHHEQAHNDQAMLYKKYSKRFTYLIVFCNAFAALFSNWPWAKEFEQTGSNGGLCERSEATRQVMACTFVSVTTIVVTGLQSSMGADAAGKENILAARTFRELLLRFEDLVSRGIPYDGMVMPATGLWADWQADFKRALDQAPLFHPAIWNKCRQNLKGAGILLVMKARLKKLEETHGKLDMLSSQRFPTDDRDFESPPASRPSPGCGQAASAAHEACDDNRAAPNPPSQARAQLAPIQRPAPQLYPHLSPLNPQLVPGTVAELPVKNPAHFAPQGS